MAYDKSMKELMDEIRKQQAPSIAELTAEDDFLFDDPVAEEKPQINLDVCIRQTLQDLEPHRLSEEDQQTVREFLTFRVQTRQAPAEQPEARRAYYNLLIHAEEKESIRQFVDILRMALDIPQANACLRTEQEMLRRMENSARRENRPGESPLLPRGTRLILIDECRETPMLNLNGNGAAREASRKEIEAYHLMWQTLFAHVRKNPETILIVASDEDVYRSTLRPFNTLSQRICSHHIQLRPQTQEDLLEDCLTELRNSSFALAEDLEPALRAYFRNAYTTSELRGQAFVADVIDRIYSRYYSAVRQEHTLDAGCVPQYDPMTQSAESILGQLEGLVGLETVKKEFRNIYKMQIAGLKNMEDSRYHMLFSGNPGTGKTTVARLTAELFFRMGVIKSNKLVTVKPCDLVSEWIGGTGIKAMEVIRRAYNGVLFIDEAYGIANMDRGGEVLNVLVQEMENNGDKLVVIFAGYTEEMRELLKTNPGLASRIGQEIHFPDYSQEELAQIFLQMCKKDGFQLDPSARDELDDCIGALMTREFFGNAREIRNMLQDLKQVWSEDYFREAEAQGNMQIQMDRVFLPQHFVKIMPPKKEVSINDLIGLDVMKQKLAAFKRQAMYQKHLQEKGFQELSDFSMHMIFTGNPGTGKTTVAKLIADDLYSIGMLKTNRLVVAERKDLIGIHGDTGRKTADMIRKAVGGVLFIDEAYSLTASRYGNDECVEVLLTAMEAHKNDTVFIFAGYVDQMQEFMMSNPGIMSRIGYTFHFEDYSADELTKMYGQKMKKMGFVVSEDALERVREIMEYFRDVKNFGNGRFVNHVIHQTISQRANRDFSTCYRNIHSQDIPSFKTLIETAPNGMQLYDPATVSEERQYRTAIHELGHTAVMIGLDPENIPQSVSIRSQAGSYGRVKPSDALPEHTEQKLLEHIAVLLGGKNAEKLVLGSHATGCASDYARAKRIAEDMVEHYAMHTFGTTAAQILEAADKLSTDTLARYRDRIEHVAPLLIRKKELTGEEISKALQQESAVRHGCE